MALRLPKSDFGSAIQSQPFQTPQVRIVEQAAVQPKGDPVNYSSVFNGFLTETETVPENINDFLSRYGQYLNREAFLALSVGNRVDILTELVKVLLSACECEDKSESPIDLRCVGAILRSPYFVFLFESGFDRERGELFKLLNEGMRTMIPKYATPFNFQRSMQKDRELDPSELASRDTINRISMRYRVILKLIVNGINSSKVEH